mmetsp:Transcript_36853/g.93039  ORF Transcript_36853/g.93039 Transcript_36853/m.93039 type:complete len:498 (-) Transcript_36853:640-2133(-)
MLDAYKAWVRKHPGIVSNLDWLLYLTVWSPTRQNSTASEFQYEGYHALVGLLSVWHQHIIDEPNNVAGAKPPPALWLDLLEQVETLMELRAMQMESLGRMSRYGPLTALEIIKSLLKMALWAHHPGHMFLRHPAPEDVEQWESAQGLQDVVEALARLRARYTTLSDCSSAAAADISSQVRGALNTVGSGVTAALSHIKGGHAMSAGSGPAASGADACSHQSQQHSGAGSAGGGAAASCSARPSDEQGGEQAEEEEEEEEGVLKLPDGVINWATVPGFDAAGTSTSTCHSAAEAAAAAAAERAASHASASPSRSARMRARGSEVAGSSPGGLRPMPVSQQQHMGMNLIWLGEMLHIWRPVVYVANLHRHGRKSWRPWLYSLFTDMAASYFTQRGKLLLRRASEQPGASHGTSLLSLALLRGLSTQHWSPGEVSELGERRHKLWLYLLRSPVVDALVRPPLAGVARATRRVPLLGAATEYAAGMLDMLTSYYTYTSGSS